MGFLRLAAKSFDFSLTNPEIVTRARVMLATRAGLTPAVAPASTRRSRMPSLARPHGARRAPRTVAVARASVSSSSGDEEVVPELLDEDDSRRNELEWDAQSSTTGLSAQLRTTNALRERLSREMFHVKPEEVAPDVVYRSQVHEARGSEDYNALMTAWRPMIKRQLLDFTYDTERAFCPEAGVLLVRWRAEWDGAFNADAQMLNFIEENFPDYAETNAEEYARLKRDVDDPTNSRSFTGDREYAVRGITTIKVNAAGLVTSHEDLLVAKGEYMMEAPTRSQDDGDGIVRRDKIVWRGDEEYNTGGTEMDADERAARDEFAVTVFYNALRPPGAKAVPWFFDVLLELEWQYFRRQVGDDTTVIQNKEEFVNTIVALLFGVVVLPTAIITSAVILAVTQGEIPALSGGDKYDMLIQEANAEDVRKGKDVVGAKGAKAPEPKLDADLLRTLYGAKIGL